jgi:hypothetical protein
MCESLTKLVQVFKMLKNQQEISIKKNVSTWKRLYAALASLTVALSMTDMKLNKKCVKTAAVVELGLYEVILRMFERESLPISWASFLGRVKSAKISQ